MSYFDHWIIFFFPFYSEWTVNQSSCSLKSASEDLKILVSFSRHSVCWTEKWPLIDKLILAAVTELPPGASYCLALKSCCFFYPVLNIWHAGGWVKVGEGEVGNTTEGLWRKGIKSDRWTRLGKTLALQQLWLLPSLWQVSIKNYCRSPVVIFFLPSCLSVRLFEK